MSDVTVKMILADAQRLVTALADILWPGCERLATAGSVRRCDAHVGDIELLAIARENEDGLFGANPDAPTQLDVILQGLADEGRIRIDKDGPAWKRVWLIKPERWLDLFIAEPSTWWVQMAIRTGPAALSKALVTQRSKGGLLRDDLSIAEGWRVWEGRVVESLPEGSTAKPAVLHRGDLVPIESEEHFFSLMSCGWLEAIQRTTWSNKHLVRGERF